MRKNDDAVDKPKRLTKGETAELLGIGIDVSKLSETRGLFISDKALFYKDSLLEGNAKNISGCVFYKCTVSNKLVESSVLLFDCTLLDQDSFSFNLQKANLRRDDLTGANLTGANLTGADLTLANLTDADLTVANLKDADLLRTNLTDADLTGANLKDAYLIRAKGLRL